jgi:hypothetical protein
VEHANSSSSVMVVLLFSSSAVSLARMRASSTSFARVARMEWGQSTGPFALETPRAILSSRFDGGTGPLNGVSRCAGRASRVLERSKIWSGFHSQSISSWFELFQLSVLFLFVLVGKNKEGEHIGEAQVRGV